MADPGTEISFAGIFISSAFAACFAEAIRRYEVLKCYYYLLSFKLLQLCTIPLDIAKVRLQLQKRVASGEGAGVPKYRGTLGTIATIAREEGLLALWKGIIPGLHRQCLYGGLRISLYEPVSRQGLLCWQCLRRCNFIHENTCCFDNWQVNTSPFLSIIVFNFHDASAIAIAVANPTDLVKVRLQAEGKSPAGVARHYSGALDAYYTIVKQEGLVALWTGLGPNIARNAIINAAELASYDQVKQIILNIPGFVDNFLTHILAGLVAGFFAVCIGSPVDVVKSRMMGDSVYGSTLDCFIKTLQNEGPFAFYKGFLPNFGRLGSWNVIMFLTLEQVRFTYPSFCIIQTVNLLLPHRISHNMAADFDQPEFEGMARYIISGT
ncbi:hypothetical protein RJ640_015306 [Escallonia rubra]|uniref:Uncharacterized protein n=1 Tax=Escallonia rubra TaxID=112253 RepID=A0AA88R5V4_9ASTE|nr:hypothetical protein RJ640_015306 [Escallonia rubra]